MYGPTEGCTLMAGERAVAVGAIEKDRRQLVRFPGDFKGTVPMSLQSEHPEANIRLEFVKRYQERLWQ